LIVVLFIGGDNSRKRISMAKWTVNKRLKKKRKKKKKEKKRKKEKKEWNQKLNTIYVGQHYAQPNTKNVNRT
jgi:hypothetical protein